MGKSQSSLNLIFLDLSSLCLFFTRKKTDIWNCPTFRSMIRCAVRCRRVSEQQSFWRSWQHTWHTWHHGWHCRCHCCFIVVKHVTDRSVKMMKMTLFFFMKWKPETHVWANPVYIFAWEQKIPSNVCLEKTWDVAITSTPFPLANYGDHTWAARVEFRQLAFFRM